MNGRGLSARLPAVLAALCFAVVEALAGSRDPGDALWSFFIAPLSDPWRLSALLGTMAPLLVAGLGAGVAFRAGIFNLGGEGQTALGFLAGALLLENLHGVPAGLALLAGFAVAGLSGAAMAALSGLAERRLGASVLLSSFLLSQAVLVMVDWAVAGPFRDPASNLLGMAPLPGPLLLPRPFGALGPGLAIFLALAVGAAMSWLLKASRPGFELELFGRSREFAGAQGFGGWLDVWPLALSGALSGIAGLLVLTGGTGQPIQGLTAGLGWNGLAVALVAGTDPLLSLPSAFLFAWLSEGAKAASILSDLSPATASVITALIVLLVTAKIEGRGRRALGELMKALRTGKLP